MKPRMSYTGINGAGVSWDVTSRWLVSALSALLTASFLAPPAVVAAAATVSLQTLSEFALNPKNPQGGLLQAADGNFYGTTAFGGTNAENGTIFRLTAGGLPTVLFSFNGTNGSHPLASLIEGADGNFYGTTPFGGSNANNGTIFKISRSGVFVSLYSFKGSDGSSPMGSLVEGSDGDFYGTTAFGGTASSTNGTVFKISAAGLFTSLASFPSNGRTGRGPMGSLVQGTDGNFYGTASTGGTTENGTVFKITPTGTLSALVSFSGPNGSVPVAGLLQGGDVNFYGTTEFGGVLDNGTVFKVPPGGVVSTLYSFNGPD